MNEKRIVLDTETTGINKNGIYYINHKIIEIGAVVIINRKITNKKFHYYLNPNKKISYDAYKVHKISNDFLINKPLFKDICNEFIKFIYGSILIIHNAKFDIDFINYELKLINHKIKNILNICKVIDSLDIARKKFPGKKNSLEALCERFKIDKKNLHSAINDSNILAKIFLLLTRGQKKISFKLNNNNNNKILKNNINNEIIKYKITYANNKEIKCHKNFLQYIEKKYRLK
ncbi:DNA polymerase III epsilon subunit [endosymbiont of Euscepes postfasciatus]|uniref:DNA polymerase III subunit epsilon n=1 Tax=endosymbiont of Euscepes postfasciatus TaxID=650377 RepID=UPI000DC73D2B|nr:DNA polymerase III subunit epsilon [endosymbiont of Euscepes postfasciatus]BBA84628.1 DNA polymerase III epsilon subunit [endosymbiont of Euscepes postfasciatus]